MLTIIKVFFWVFATVVILGKANIADAAQAKKKNSSYNSAKVKCLDENPNLAGKALQKCIKRKQKIKNKVY